eukprot:CAMPEP_0171709426 /NCGR_PEP_ID=MMETSP0991-20121206/15459_1 /TAXON_ID=483369 /ORGANISM="non described non described, Strain CCMP2098" /LENGTH=624 /DNA_ID=CAMNT_0012299507 /DNA_START=17 /DNA_END=1892 /DNA_ORIENTATION=-
MVLNLGLPDLPLPKPFAPELSPWLTEYIGASTLELYGFLPDPKHFGQTFKAVAVAMGRDFDIALFAAQVEGLLLLNPGEKVTLDEKPRPRCAQQRRERGHLAPHFCKQPPEFGTAQLKRKMALLKLDQGVQKGSGKRAGDHTESAQHGSSDHKAAHGADRLKGGALALGRQIKALRQLTSVSKLTSAKPQPRTRRAASHSHRRRSSSSVPLSQPNLTNDKVPEEASLSGAGSGGSGDGAQGEALTKFAPGEDLLRVGGHVVICLFKGSDDEGEDEGLYAQVEVIVSNLRYFADTAVVVLGPNPGAEGTELLTRIREKYSDKDGTPNVFFVEGDPLDPKGLLDAGTQVAEHFLSLSSPSPLDSSETEDRVNLLAQGVLDNQLREWGRADLSPVYDWCSTDSFPMMPEPPSPLTANPSVDPLPHLTAQDKAFAGSSPRCHYRFASGGVLPKPLIAGVFSMAYYTPGVLELFEALIDPSKTDQESSAWPVPVPTSQVGSSYAAFALTLLESGGVPIGLLRGQGGPLPYVLSVTPADKSIVLKEGDAVYALATMDWAAANLNFTATHGLGTDQEEPAGAAADKPGVGATEVMVSNPMTAAVATSASDGSQGASGVEMHPFPPNSESNI